MNTMLIQQGLSLSNQLRQALKDKSSEKKRTFYDELRASSANIDDLRDYLEILDKEDERNLSKKVAEKRKEARAAAGPVTQAAHVRLQRAKEQLALDSLANDALDFDAHKKRLGAAAESAEDTAKGLSDKLVKKIKPLRKRAEKRAKKLEKSAAKARKQTEKKVRKQATKVADKVTGKEQKRKERRRNAGITAGIIAALIALGAAAYYFLIGRSNTGEKASDLKPPRVEEYSGKKDAKLVYSTSTDGKTDTRDTSTEPVGIAEEPAERDEELLSNLDEQLSAHRAGQDAIDEVSAKIDEATGALAEETKAAQEEFDQQSSSDDNDDKDEK